MTEIDYTQLSAIVIIVLFLIKEVFAFLTRKNSNGSLIRELRDNHLHGIETKLDEVQYITRELDKKMERVITLLVEIKSKLK